MYHLCKNFNQPISIFNFCNVKTRQNLPTKRSAILNGDTDNSIILRYE